MEFKDVSELIRGKVCMITGGGGSIGSETARTLAAMGAGQIVIADIYENGAYDVKCEIGDNAVVEIASVRDYDRMDYITAQYKPDIIFHAAAHKHVPFMEQNPEEAVKNNIRGTEIMTELAQKHSAKCFVLISTDKAVEPISVMGASKRICEMLVYEKSLTSKHTKFTAVRFGNVIGSCGSVIPLFEKQAKKGLVTVTDREVTRYFMTLRQAAELVICSAVIAEGGELFVLDMGDDVKIIDVAEKVIRSCGREPYKDVKIEITGLRKGDKLHEKLFFDFEKRENTEFDKIFKTKGSSKANLSNSLDMLYKMAEKADREGIRKLIFSLTNEGE